MGEDVVGRDGSALSDGLCRVAVLFAKKDSVYKTMPRCDVYDAERDARNYDGPWPVVAHPPCRAWATLRHHAKPAPHQRNLARLAVALVREFGGVLEHPHRTTLWAAQRMPCVVERVRDKYLMPKIHAFADKMRAE